MMMMALRCLPAATSLAWCWQDVSGQQNEVLNSTVQLSPVPSKRSRFWVEFRELSRVRSTESSGFMERAMGIEPTSEAWEASILPLYDARSSLRRPENNIAGELFATMLSIVFSPIASPFAAHVNSLMK